MGNVQNLRPFPKGVSGNPKGRPAGIARRTRELVGDGDALVEVLLSIANDDSARNADRIAATRELLDRGWGRAPAHAPLEHSDPLELDELDRAILQITEQLKGSNKPTAPNEN